MIYFECPNNLNKYKNFKKIGNKKIEKLMFRSFNFRNSEISAVLHLVVHVEPHPMHY